MPGKYPKDYTQEIIVVCSEIHTKHKNTLIGQRVEILNVKFGGFI
jgi:hypothetical protein